MGQDKDLVRKGSRKRYEAELRAIRRRIATSRPGQTTAIREILSTPTAFEAWLEKHKDNEVVGDMVNSDTSELANFLWDELGVYVDTFDLIYYEKDRIEPPSWFMRYTRWENRARFAPPGSEARSEISIQVTAKQALEFLHQALAEGFNG